ncbi:hypothetical protein AB0K00_09440 [Dactylosporangium sp. NPDC049525]|uniref:hypothetical protein n=1 Tax=Dactylosporangium sp. NPDC049525 TaxID=3154730 RepID=UPI00342112B5
MTRRPLWRPLLTVVTYVAVTVLVLLFGVMSLHQNAFFRGDGRVVGLLLGGILLLLGAGRLVLGAVRTVHRFRGH